VVAGVTIITPAAMSSEGATATIVACEKGLWTPVGVKWVEKRYKRHIKRSAMEHERRMHGDIQYLLEQEALRVPAPKPSDPVPRVFPLNDWLLAASPAPPMMALRVPRLSSEKTRYIMEQIDVSRPLWESKVSDEQIKALVTGLLCLWRKGYEMRDVEVYIQPDGSLCMLDFGQVTNSPEASTKILSAAIVPASEVERIEMELTAKTAPPTIQKMRCPLGCFCQCCEHCSRELCYGRCGVEHKEHRFSGMGITTFAPGGWS